MFANLETVAAISAALTYQLEILLLGAKPPVWRTLQVPGQANLGWLHAVLQTAMGWTNSQLHHFLTEDARYSDPRGNEDLGFDGDPTCPYSYSSGLERLDQKTLTLSDEVKQALKKSKDTP